MSEKMKMSSSRKALLETVRSIGLKAMSIAPAIAIFGLVLDNKYLPTDIWMLMLPLTVVAGAAWYWASSQLPD